MEDLIARIAAAAGVEPEIAEKSVETILAFLRKEGPQAEVDALFAAVPGAAEAADAASGESGGSALNGLTETLIANLAALRLRTRARDDEPTGWMCRLCDLDSCGRTEGECPAANAAQASS